MKQSPRRAFTVLELILTLTAAGILMLALGGVFNAIYAGNSEKTMRFNNETYHVVPSTRGGADARLSQSIIQDLIGYSTERYVFFGKNQAAPTDATWPKPLSAAGINAIPALLATKIPAHRRGNVKALAALLGSGNYSASPHDDDVTLVCILGDSVLGYAQQTCKVQGSVRYYAVTVAVTRDGIIPGVNSGATFSYRVCFPIGSSLGAVPPGASAWHREAAATINSGWGIGETPYYTVVFADPVIKPMVEHITTTPGTPGTVSELGIGFSRFTYGIGGFR